MGAEVGATTSTFPYSENMRNYLHATGRGPVADAADRAAGAGFLEADQGAEYDEVIEIVCHLLHNTLSSPPLELIFPRSFRSCSTSTHTRPAASLIPRTFPNSNLT